MWDFRNESTHPAAGANNAAGRIAGYQPYYFLGRETDNAYKRNVIKTSKGWVRRENRGTRQIDEVLVAAGDKLSGGFPDVAFVYATNANGVSYDTAVAKGWGQWSGKDDAVNINVVFNEPIEFKASGNTASIAVANTAGGNNNNAYANANPYTHAEASITNANNTLVFRNTGPGVVGTYKIAGQTISITGGGHSIHATGNTSAATARFANLVITGAVSNNQGTFVIGAL